MEVGESMIGVAARALAAVLLCAAPLAATAPRSGPDAGRRLLQPILECVVQHGPASFTAHFGYRNDGEERLEIAAGPRNTVTPAPAERGQPTSFAPGRTPRFPASAFKLDFDGRPIAWTLVGRDGRPRTAMASASSRRCQAPRDASAPRLYARSPRAGAFLASRRQTLELGYEDDGALDLGSLRVTIDGVDRTPWFTAGPRSARAERELEDGRHTLEASIKDDAGRTGSVSLAFTIDTVAPQLSVLDPSPGALVSGASVDVSGGVADASAVSVSVGARDAAVKGRAFRARQVPLGPGPVLELPLVARDAAGNTSTASLRLRVESEAPSVRIESPRAGSDVKGPTLRVSGTVRSAHAVAVEVNGREAAVDGGAFRLDLPVKAGSLELRAVARSASGLLATDTVTLRVDTEAPELVVEDPQPDSATSARSVRVSGRVSDAKATVRINGTLALLGDGAFSGTVALPREGVQTVLVVAQDPAGNRSEVEVPVRVDRTAPELSLLSLPEDAPVDGRSVTVAGAISDAGAVSVTVNGRLAERLERGWRADLSGLAPGSHVLEAVARDEAGNETRVRRTVTVEEPLGAAGGGRERRTAAAGGAGRRNESARDEGSSHGGHGRQWRGRRGGASALRPHGAADRGGHGAARTRRLEREQ